MSSLIGRLAAVTAIVLAAVSCAFTGSGGLVLKAPGGGEMRALVMGIDNPNLDSTVGHGAKADADDVTSSLEAGGVAAENVTELVDGDVTRARLIAEMDRLAAEARSGDLVVVTFSGAAGRFGGRTAPAVRSDARRCQRCGRPRHRHRRRDAGMVRPSRRQWRGHARWVTDTAHAGASSDADGLTHLTVPGAATANSPVPALTRRGASRNFPRPAVFVAAPVRALVYPQLGALDGNGKNQ